MSVSIAYPRVSVSVAGLGIKVGIATQAPVVRVVGQQGPAGPAVPAGSDGEVVFSQGGVAAFDPNLVFNQALKQLSVPAASFQTLAVSSDAIFSGLAYFGGKTSAFPALQRTGTTLQAVLADNSKYAPFEAASLHLYTTGGGTGALTNDGPATLGGNSLYINNATGDHSVYGPAFLGWTTTTTVPAPANPAVTRLYRDADHVLAMRNGANAQAQRWYYSYVDPSNYARGVAGWNGTTFEVGTEGGGTFATASRPLRLKAAAGGNAPIYFNVNGADRWLITYNGLLMPATNNGGSLGYEAGNLIGYVKVGTAVHVYSQYTDGNNFNRVRLSNNGNLQLVAEAYTAGVASNCSLIIGATGAGGSVLQQINGATVGTWAAGGLTLPGTLTASTGRVIGQTVVASGAGITGTTGVHAYYVAGTAGVVAALDSSGQASQNLRLIGQQVQLGYGNTGTVGLTLDANGNLTATGTLNLGSSGFLVGETANVLALRNGATAQAFRVYNNYADPSNWDRASMAMSGNFAVLQTEQAGTGVARHLAIRSAASTSIYIGAGGGADKWIFQSTGDLTPAVDNTYSIGTNGQRVYNGYFSNNLFVGNQTTAKYVSITRVDNGNNGWTFSSTDGTLQFDANGYVYAFVLKQTGDLTLSGALTTTAVQTTGNQVANLPAATGALQGTRRHVTDSTVAAAGNYGAVVVGGGSNVVPVFCTGTAWIIG